MNATTVAVDLAKSVFQLAVADDQWRVVETHRLTRSQFERWFANRDVALVIMEACGSAHHWGRWLLGLGIQVKLLPAAYVRAYVKRNKTDRADACALLEAARASDMVPVKVKSMEQQALQGLHRIRSLWMATRTARINALRGFCREFGLTIPQGSRTGIEAIGRALADPHVEIPGLIRGSMALLIEEIRLLEQRIAQLERELTEVARQSPACVTLLSVPGIGLLTATAMVLFFKPIQDSQSGMWVFKREILPKLKLTSDGMPLSQEIKLEAIMRGFRFGEAHIPYGARIGEVKLQKWRDGWLNLLFLVQKRFGLV